MPHRWLKVQTVVQSGTGLPRDDLSYAQASATVQHALAEWRAIQNDSTARGILRAAQDCVLSGHSVVLRSLQGTVSALGEAGVEAIGQKEIASVFFALLAQLSDARCDAEAQNLLGNSSTSSDILRATMKGCSKHHAAFDVQMVRRVRQRPDGAQPTLILPTPCCRELAS